MEAIFNLTKKFLESDDTEKTLLSESSTAEEKLTPINKIMKEELYLNLSDINKLGNYVENYFFLKLKKFLAAKDDFAGNYSIIKHIQNIKDSVLNYIKDKKGIDEKKRDLLKIKGINLIEEAEKIFKSKSNQIQIDSFFPNVNGKTIKKFYNEVKEYSHCSKDFLEKIDEMKNYNLIIESTHNILSTLNKKGKQLKNYFIIFSQTKKLYMENKEMLHNFYLGFLRSFKVISDGEDVSDNNMIEKSNFIYAICSNKHYSDTKIFQESLYNENQFKNLINKMKISHDKSQEKKKDNNQSKKNQRKKDKQTKNEQDKKVQQTENDKVIANKIEEDIKTVDSRKNMDENKMKDNKEDYEPEKYLVEFKQILDAIEENNECYLLVYLDSYDKLFIPYSVIKDRFNDLSKLYNKMNEIEKMNPEIYLKIKDMEEKYQKLEKEHEQYQKLEKEHEQMKMLFKEIHPEYFDEKGEILKLK